MCVLVPMLGPLNAFIVIVWYKNKLLTEGGYLQICVLETLMCNLLHRCVYLFQEVLFFRPCLFCHVHHALFGSKSHLKNTPTHLFTHPTLGLLLCYCHFLPLSPLDYLIRKSMLRGRNTLKLSVLPGHF